MTGLLERIFIGKKAEMTAGVRRRYGYLSAFTGVFLNVLLFVGKLVAGIVSGAVSVMADAFNNLSDAGSSIMTFVGFKIAGMPADKNHPFGHGRMEYVSGLVISFIIVLMGVELGISSIKKIIHPESMKFSGLSLGILIASVGVKLWMSVFNRKLGEKTGSAVIRAASMDSLTDCVATTAVIIGMLLAKFAHVNIDGFIGALVALFIIYTGINTCRDSLSPLLGEKADSSLATEIQAKVLGYENIVGVHDMIVHDYGVGNIIISLHAEVPCYMDFVEAHELVDVIEDNLRSEYNCLATIHMDPVAYGDKQTDEIKSQVMDVLININPQLTMHDFRMTNGENLINLIFDVVAPYDCKIPHNTLQEQICSEIKKCDSRYNCKINIDNEFV